MSATPTPWKLDGLNISVPARGLVARAFLPRDGGVMEAVSNAAFIVTAVNAHADLMAALETVTESAAWQDMSLTEQETVKSALAKAVAP